MTNDQNKPADTPMELFRRQQAAKLINDVAENPEFSEQDEVIDAKVQAEFDAAEKAGRIVRVTPEDEPDKIEEGLNGTIPPTTDVPPIDLDGTSLVDLARKWLDAEDSLHLIIADELRTASGCCSDNKMVIIEVPDREYDVHLTWYSHNNISVIPIS